MTRLRPSQSSELFAGVRIGFLSAASVIFVGGIADWIYINSQEGSLSLTNAFAQYLESYASAIFIAGIEIAAAFYFMQRYELGKERKLLLNSALIGLIGFFVYLTGEFFAGVFSLGAAKVPIGELLYFELAPTGLDYGNAMIIFLDLFALLLLLQLLFRINPVPKRNTGLSKGAGFLGAVWTSGITTFSATVCCGPLPVAIALATGLSTLYFTAVINLQSLLDLASIPLILVSVYLANRRASIGCRLRQGLSAKASNPTSHH
jgi:hypothetical protein